VTIKLFEAHKGTLIRGTWRMQRILIYAQVPLSHVQITIELQQSQQEEAALRRRRNAAAARNYRLNKWIAKRIEK
jgi:hypothetical protein